MPRLARAGLVALTLLLAAVGAVAAGYLADSHGHEGKALRNVTLAGTNIGGLDRTRLAPIVKARATRFEKSKITIDATGGGFTTTAKALGAHLDPDETAAAALEVGRAGNAVGRLTFWAKSWIVHTEAPIRVGLSASNVREAVLRLDKGTRVEPVEPSVAYKKGAFTSVDGKPGKGIDPADVIRQLPEAIEHGGDVVVRVGRGSVAPRFSDGDAKRLAGQAQGIVTHPIAVKAGDTTATVPLATLRTWVTTKTSDDQLVLGLEADKALAGLEKLLAAAGEAPVETTFSVDNGAVTVVPGKDGSACCAPAAAGLLERAVFRRLPDAVDLPLRPKPPKVSAEGASKLGIKEVVATFTTKHPGGQPRVANIHRISDLVRGQVILPGDTFSVNSFVGPRTTAKGFVVDHVIEDGRFSEAVGGGISQFATTFFNAAFFAGLDLVEYQSHSIYISRYPYGREATLNYPKPDLVIKNTTPYGVLIWPTYTGTTVTVTLYSTKFVTADQTGQKKEARGQCTRVTTERTKTYVEDGHTVVDHVSALYRPAEGLDCAGQPTPSSTTSTTSTTAPPGPPPPSTAPPTTAKP